MEKADLIAKVRDEIRSQFERMLTAAKAAASYATDEETKPDGKYDTQSTEASYLAAGQAEKAEELALDVELFETLELPNFDDSAPIAPGALVEVELEDGDIAFYLLAPRGGGTVINHLGCKLTVLTPDSPLAQKLEGKRAGDQLDEPNMTIYTVS